MSILADILSKIKHPEPRRDIPPGLRSTVSALRKKELNKRRVIILLIFAAIALSSGSVTVYLMQTFLPRTNGLTPVVRGLPGERLKSAGESREIARSKGPTAVEQTSKPRTFEIEPHITIKQPEYKPEYKREEIKRKPTVRPESIAQKEKPKVEEKGVKEQPDVSSEVRTSETKDLYLYMGGNYEKKGDYYNAISSYKKVLDIEPKNYRVMNKIAYILIQIASNEEALKYLENALSIKHDHVPALINTGIVYAKAEKFSDAEKHLLKALSLEEANQPALFNIATLYEKQGKYDLARQHYLKLKNLGNDQGRLGIERIEGLTTSKK
ncbi:MAG: hypothetical protein QMC83_06330 [Thermodesulfovibrionales bacterium]|nr:hypothetical protein [Thermodesulfovibrionales bacterium]